ncbi:MAG: hypothetical protein ABWY20_16875 [Mycobacterium sp.]
MLSGCIALVPDGPPPLAWTLLRDARSLHEVSQHRRAVIDAATAAELAVTKMLDSLLTSHTLTKRAKLLKQNQMLGQKTALLGKLGSPLSQSFYDDLVCKRNDAVHDGVNITPAECEKAIAEAVGVVETAYPLPVPRGFTHPLQRHW